MENVFQNPVVVKVHNGTMHSEVHLCSTCRWAFHARSSESGMEIVGCQAMGRPIQIREKIGRCTHYLDRNHPTLDAMLDIAWSLMTDKGGRSLGFLSPEELRKRGEGTSQPPTIPGFR